MSRRPADRAVLKLVISGGFGVGKTTLIGAVSEIEPLRTEETLTEASAATDSLNGVAAKSTTTVALDFGRITFDVPRPMEMYLFGTSGQSRFWWFWDYLTVGAHGVVVLIDTRRLEDSFAVVDYFERSGLPFIVAVNVFAGAARYPANAIRSALRLSEDTPVVFCDARSERSAARVLITLAKHALASAPGPVLESRP